MSNSVLSNFSTRMSHCEYSVLEQNTHSATISLTASLYSYSLTASLMMSDLHALMEKMNKRAGQHCVNAIVHGCLLTVNGLCTYTSVSSSCEHRSILSWICHLPPETILTGIAPVGYIIVVAGLVYYLCLVLSTHLSGHSMDCCLV